MVAKETDKGADKTQEAAGKRDTACTWGRQLCAPQVSSASTVPLTCSKVGTSSDLHLASKDLAVLHRLAGDGLRPRGVLWVRALLSLKDTPQAVGWSIPAQAQVWLCGHGRQ